MRNFRHKDVLIVMANPVVWGGYVIINQVLTHILQLHSYRMRLYFV